MTLVIIFYILYEEIDANNYKLMVNFVQFPDANEIDFFFSILNRQINTGKTQTIYHMC